MIRVLDRAQAVAFGLLGLGCIYGAIAKGAWWHIGTMLMCLAIAAASWKDAKNELKDMQCPFPIGNGSEEDLE